MKTTPPDIRTGADLTTLATGLDHPEAVCWDPDRGVVFAGGEAGQLYRVGLDGRVETVCVIDGGSLLGLAIDGAGALYACDAGNGRVWRIDPDTGDATPVGPPMGYPNYPAFGPDGALWVSDSGAWERPEGLVWRIDPDGSATRWPVGPLAFANGLAVRDDQLYVVESAAARVVRAPFAGGTPEVVVELPATVPDGIAFDASGGLWVGCFQPNRVYRVAADRTVDPIVDDWSGECVLSPTNLAFVGPDRATLALASLCGRSLSTIDPGVSGAPLLRPATGPRPSATEH